MIDDYAERPSESTEYERKSTRTTVPYDAYDKTREQRAYHQKKAVVRSYNLIWFVVGVIDVLLAFRFFFELSAANSANPFVQFIYTLSYPFAGPFQTIFGMTSVSYSIFDWSLLVAIVVYLLIGYALIQLLRIIRPMTPEDVNHRIHTV